MVVLEMNCKVCGNTSTKNTSVSFFRFPKENSKCRDWADRCDLLELFETHGALRFHKSFRICSQHFHPKDVVFDGRKNRLLDSATPHLSALAKNPSTDDDLHNFALQLPQNLCRLCAEQDYNMTDIFGWRGKKLNLETKLKYFPQVINKHDILPLKICNQCVSKVNQLYDFILNCTRAETKLRAMLDTKVCNPSPQLTKSHSDSPCKPDWDSGIETNSNETPKLIHCPNLLTSFPANMAANSSHQLLPDSAIPGHAAAEFPKNFSFDHDYSSVVSGDQLLPPNDQGSMEEAKLACHGCSESFQDCEALSGHSLAQAHSPPRDWLNELCDGVFCSRFPFEDGSQVQEEKCVCTVCDKNLDDKDSFAHRSAKDLRFVGTFIGEWALTSFWERLVKENDVSVHRSVLGVSGRFILESCCRACRSRGVKRCCELEQTLGESCQCGKKLSKKRARPSHNETHSEESHQCTECGKFLRSKASLRQHRSVHSEKRVHNCRECGMSFKRKDTLCNHLRIHTGERPFMCKVCGFAFKQRGDCMKHENNHRKDGDCQRKRELWGEKAKAVDSSSGGIK